jgi:hypothetical protein
MMPSTAIPSLMDDVEFLAALDSLEGEPELDEAERKKRLAALRPMAPPLARPSSPLQPANDPVIPRDVNRWFLEAPPNVAPPPRIHKAPTSPIRTFVVVFAGASAGAFGAMLLFYDRVAQILAVWVR